MFCNSPVLTATSEASRRAPVAKRNVRRVIDSYLRHGNTYLLRLLRNGIHQPAFRFVARLLDHFPPTDFSAIHFDIISETIEPPKPNSRAIIRRPVMLLD